jgi:AcrR family transcriptional regulator
MQPQAEHILAQRGLIPTRFIRAGAGDLDNRLSANHHVCGQSHTFGIDVKSPSAPVPRARQRDRRATEDELVAAAAVAFAEKGYEKATTRSIADAAGCSEGLIQRYFNGKEGLLLAVLKRQGTVQRDRFFERPLCPSMVEEAREMMSHGMAAFVTRSEKIRIVLSRVLIDTAFQADFQRISNRPQVQKSLRQRLARYVDAGMIDPALDLDVVTELLLSLIFQLGFVHRELHQTEATDIERMIDGFADLFARGVMPVPADRTREGQKT